MKRTMLLILALLLCATPIAARAEAPQKDLTVMVYMCGSNLESQYGSASADINEIAYSGVDTDRVNVLVLTGGSSAWHNGLDATQIQLGKLKGTQLLNKSDLLSPEIVGLSMGDPEVLRQFIACGVEQYSAERYALVLWDHGAGPLEGVCYDEINEPDRLSLEELAQALGDAPLPGKLSWIGFDACLMSTAEVALAVSPYAEYMVASQETEPAAGWDYGFLGEIADDADGAATGRRIVDSYFEGENAGQANLTLSCLDLSRIEGVIRAMDDFFAPIGRNMKAETFAELSGLRMASASFGRVARGITDQGYDLVDLGDLIEHCGTLQDSAALKEALSGAVVYSRSDEAQASGLSVYHPLRNKQGYLARWKEEYAGLDFSDGYRRYLDAFGTLLTGGKLADWSNIRLTEDGVGPDGEFLYSLPLDEVQQENFASAQLVVLGALATVSDDGYYSYGAQLAEGGAPDEPNYAYYPVSVGEASLDADGLLTAGYKGRGLYAVDGAGEILAGPLGYSLSDDGEYWYIDAWYRDASGRENPMPDTSVIYTCRMNAAGDGLDVVSTEVYDRITETYTRRIGFSEDDFTRVTFARSARAVPEIDGALPGYWDWENITSEFINLQLPLEWRLSFIDAQMSGAPLFATMQIVDAQQNTYCTPLVRVDNPNLYTVKVSPASQAGDDYELELYAVRDDSPSDPGLSLGVRIRNNADVARSYLFDAVVFNGTRSAGDEVEFTSLTVPPGKTAYKSCRLDGGCFEGLSGLETIDLVVKAFSPEDYGTIGNTSFSFSLDDGGAPPFRALPEVPLGEVTQGDMTWQLASLQRTPQGGLKGLLHIVYDGDTEQYRSAGMVINDTVQDDEIIYVSAHPHTDVCVPFEIDDRVTSDYAMSVAGTDSSHFLGLDRLLERFGVEKVTALTFYTSNDRTVRFELEEPIPFAAPEEVARLRDEGGEGAVQPLLEGDISVDAGRLLVADNGAALRLTLRNNTDRGISLTIANKTINGRSYDTLLVPSYYDTDKVDLGAGAETLLCIEFRPEHLEDFPEIAELGMTFSYEDFVTPRAHIRLPEPVALGAVGGTYLSPGEYEAEPTVYRRPTHARTLPASLEVADSTLTLSLDVSNVRASDPAPIPPEDEGTHTPEFRVNWTVENHSGAQMNYSIKNVFINGTRRLRRGDVTYSVDPGEIRREGFNIDALELAGLEAVTSVEFTLNVDRGTDGASDESWPVRFEVSGYGLEGLAPTPPEALAEQVRNGVTWQLLPLSVADEDGNLTCGLWVSNDSDTALEGERLKFVVQGVYLGDGRVSLPPHTDQYLSLSVKNRIPIDKALDSGLEDEWPQDGLLQRLGVGAISDFGVLIGYDELTGDYEARLSATLSQALPLPEYDGAADLANPLMLLEDGVSTGISHVLIDEESVALLLTLRNDTGVAQPFRLYAPVVGGHRGKDAELYVSQLLLPGSVTLLPVSFALEEGIARGEALEGLSLLFLCNDELYESDVLPADEPFDFGGELLLDSDMLRLGQTRQRPMPAVHNVVALPEDMRPVVLGATEPEDMRPTGCIAFVCLRDTVKIGDGEPYDCLQVLDFVELQPEGDGRWSAPFSGLAMLGNGEPCFTVQEEPLGEDRAELSLALFDYVRRLYPGAETVDEDYVSSTRCTRRWIVDYSAGSPGIALRDERVGTMDSGAFVSNGEVILRGIDRLYIRQLLAFPDAPEMNDFYYVELEDGEDLALSLRPLDGLDGEVCMLYEWKNAEGTYDVIADYPTTDD